MYLYKKYWPLHIPPLPDELFSSWLIRIAHQYVTPVRLFWKNALPNLLFINHQEPDYSYDTKMLKELSSKTRVPLCSIHETLLPGISGNFFFQRPDWISPFGQGQNKDRKFGMSFCPMCLKEDGDNPYFRKIWRLSMVFLCSKHQVFLHDSCPRCFSPIHPFKIKLRLDDREPYKRIAKCFRCGYPLSEAKATQTNQNDIKVQQVFGLEDFVNLHISLTKLSNSYTVLKEMAELIWRSVRHESLFSKDMQKDLRYSAICYFRNISRISLANRPFVFDNIRRLILLHH